MLMSTSATYIKIFHKNPWQSFSSGRNNFLLESRISGAKYMRSRNGGGGGEGGRKIHSVSDAG
jgi:hypothetical protein